MHLDPSVVVVRKRPLGAFGMGDQFTVPFHLDEEILLVRLFGEIADADPEGQLRAVLAFPGVVGDMRV